MNTNWSGQSPSQYKVQQSGGLRLPHACVGAFGPFELRKRTSSKKRNTKRVRNSPPARRQPTGKLTTWVGKRTASPSLSLLWHSHLNFVENFPTKIVKISLKCQTNQNKINLTLKQLKKISPKNQQITHTAKRTHAKFPLPQIGIHDAHAHSHPNHPSGGKARGKTHQNWRCAFHHEQLRSSGPCPSSPTRSALFGKIRVVLLVGGV